MTASEVATDLWARIGGEPGQIERVGIVGPRADLPSVYRVTEFAAACVAVATSAAAQHLGAPPTDIEIDSRGAASVFRSERLLRHDGEAFHLWDELSGYYETADDRWVQLHCNFPHHRAGVVALLGCADTREEVAETIGTRWSALDLETALAEADMCSTMLRTRDEWLGAEQGRAVARLPLIEVVRIGDAPPRSRFAGRPLDGARVLDLTRIIAGPTCGRVLAQHGADVLRIGAGHLPTVESCVVDMGFGKRAAHIDLRRSEGRRTMAELLAGADVWVQGYRPGSLSRLGFGTDDIARAAPGIVHVSLSAYGHEGPWADRRGFDSLVQTASGIGAAGAAAAGVGGTRPLPCQALDHGTGWLLAAATMLALHRQRSEGGTWMVRSSLAQTGHYLASLGQVDDLAVAEPTAEDLQPHLANARSAWGTLTHVRPQGRLDGQLDYDSAPVPVGSDPPSWPSSS